MNIEGLDYNTHREKLIMPEYGREIQKMVDYAVGLADRDERLACARTIVKLMEARAPQTGGSEDYEQTLWDHLYLISGKRLDIDWPFDVTEAEKILSKPAPMKLPARSDHVHLRHYGHLLEKLFDCLKTMEAGPERDELTRLVANHMRRDLATWGHGTMDEEKVASDLARFTDGKIQLDLQTFRFEDNFGGMQDNFTKKRPKQRH